jgi:1,3-beta-glucan synthase
MSGHPQAAQYDDGYGQTPAHAQGQQGQQGQDGYYHDEQYGQYHDDATQQQHPQQQHPQQQQGDAYYDESCVLTLPDGIAALLTKPQRLL